jgi:hypothetical protein
MSHFAEVKNGIVTQVIVAEQDFINTLPNPNEWIQTSYNTRGGVHYDPITLTPDNGVALRANYASVGFTYDAEKDVFYSPRPLNGWVLNQNTYIWESPIPYPDDGNEYVWNEANVSWLHVS